MKKGNTTYLRPEDFANSIFRQKCWTRKYKKSATARMRVTMSSPDETFPQLAVDPRLCMDIFDRLRLVNWTFSSPEKWVRTKWTFCLRSPITWPIRRSYSWQIETLGDKGIASHSVVQRSKKTSLPGKRQADVTLRLTLQRLSGVAIKALHAAPNVGKAGQRQSFMHWNRSSGLYPACARVTTDLNGISSVRLLLSHVMIVLGLLMH